MRSATNLKYYHEMLKADASCRGIKTILGDAEIMSKRPPTIFLILPHQR